LEGNVIDNLTQWRKFVPGSTDLAAES
jgi:hypothetical protein